LGQAVNRRVTRAGLQQAYGQDPNVRKAIRSLPALAFLQTPDVIHAFDILRQTVPPITFPIFDYFQKYKFLIVLFPYTMFINISTYVYRMVNGQIRDPMFRPSRWNQYDAAVHQQQRTTNAVEGWHNSFAQRFIAYTHPPFSKYTSSFHPYLLIFSFKSNNCTQK
jgi:hypothetical protein